MKPSRTPIKPFERVVGLDVAKETVVLFDTVSRRTWTIANRLADLKEALKPFADYQLMVCEATGGHERPALEAALSLGLPACRADALKVKRYIASLGGAAKTDNIDSAWLGRYGQERGASLPLWDPPAADQEGLTSLVRHRQDLLGERTKVKNRLGAPGSERLKPFLEDQLSFLEGQIDSLDQAIVILIDQQAKLASDQKALRSIKGVGPVAARGLLAFMPELGQLSRRQAASLAGLAPHPKDSGKTAGRRRTGAGRNELRSILFMAALSASRYHPELKLFAQRLLKAGKPKRLMLIAVARKLVVIANAVLKHAQPKLT